MVGQGSPREAQWACASHCQRVSPSRTGFVGLWLYRCALAWGAMGLMTSSLLAAELDLRLRVTWGGGEPRPWRGSITARDGELANPRYLGTETNASDGLTVQPQVLRFTQPQATTASGLDVQVLGTEQTRLVLEFAPIDAPETVRTVELLLTDFISATEAAHAEPLDDRGNSLQVDRAPGDRLRVEFGRDSLVCSPGEILPLTVRPHALGIAGTSVIRCALQLQSTGSQEVLWKENHDLKEDPAGGFPAVGPVQLILPTEEGVYDLVISLTHRRFSGSLVPGTLGSLVPPRQLAQRKVQILVLGDQAPVPAPSPDEWRLVEEIDLANPKWWERFTWLPHWKVLPGMSPRGPLGDRPLVPREFLGGTLHEIGPGGWHSAPIPIKEIGRPYVLEVEYPSDRRQTLGISVVEPDGKGELRFGNVDSGVEVSAHPKPSTARLETHRFVFWPSSSTPWLLLTNRRQDVPAVFGRIRVFTGPAQLPPLELSGTEDRRLLAAHFDQPLFPENFGAQQSYDPVAMSSYQDWQTFYQGGIRLAEYLKYAGYNAAIVPVLCNGGSLYPSDRLHTTPKYDTGVLFQSGQDPVQKDVLEMLLRIFDREGLMLVPSIQFNGLIPRLESMGPAEPNHLNGVSMIGFFTGEQTARLGRDDSLGGAAPYYNPLDPRVREAMRQVADEVLVRCRDHASFAGLAVQLSAHSYSVLPDDSWCLDDTTFARFSQAMGVADSHGPDRLSQRLKLVRGTAREPWLQWRADELAGFYRDLRDDVVAIRPDARLLLTTTDLVGGRVLQAALRPRLPVRLDFSDSMLRHGLDAGRLARHAKAELLRPQGMALTSRLATDAARIELGESTAVDSYFRLADQTGAAVGHLPLSLRLPAFDAVSPFGPEKTHTELRAVIAPGGAAGRAHPVRSLAALDSRLITDGGPLLPLGQSDPQLRFVRVFRQLPAIRFETVEPSTIANTSPVVLRWQQHAGHSYIYVANPTSLAAVARVVLESTTPGVIRALDGRPVPTSPSHQGPAEWLVALEPFDVAAIESTSSNLRVSEWSAQFDRDSVAVLGELLQDVRVRLEQLSRFQPTQVLGNANFELPMENGQVPGWNLARNRGVMVKLDPAAPQEGAQSLHMRVDGDKVVGWLRSTPFPLPRTGRLTVQAWIRTAPGNPPPPVRMSIDGQLGPNQPYYRWWSLGVDVDGRTLTPTGRRVLPVPTEWSASPFLIHVADLPSSSGGQLSIGFDLLGPGEIWIDSVQVSDSYFEPTELKDLQKSVYNAQFQLQRGEFAECQRFLHSYWPRFVLEFVPPPRLTQVPPAPMPAANSPPPPGAPPLSKWRWPSIPFRSPFR